MEINLWCITTVLLVLAIKLHGGCLSGTNESMSVLTRLQGNGKGSCGLADAGLKTVILLQNRLEVSFNRSSTEFRTDIEGLRGHGLSVHRSNANVYFALIDEVLAFCIF